MVAVAVVVWAHAAVADPAKATKAAKPARAQKASWSPRRAAPAKSAQRPLPPPHITLAVLQYQAGGKSPGLVYHAAQAYRAQGDRAKAIELYDQYLQLAPDGPAAAASRAELEHLRDVPQ